MVIKQGDELRKLVKQILLEAGADESNADCVAEHLVLANLSGVDTHGVWHMKSYVDDVKNGNIVATAYPQIIKQTTTSALVHGNWAFGHLSARYAMEVSIDKAKTQGMAIVSLVASNHIGRLGHYAEMAAAQGMMCMVWAGGFGRKLARSVPFGGRKPVLDTNPVSMAAPGEQSAVMFDYATTAVSAVKIENAYRRGEKLPPNCIVDADGNPSTDPNDYKNGGFLMSFGGHKGYALMVVAELFGNIFAGADAFAAEDKGSPLFRHQGVTMFVFKADLFQTMADYMQRSADLGQRVRGTPPAPGFSEVLLPGDPEARTRSSRGRDGIPIADDVWQTVVDAAASVGIAVESD